MSLPTLDSVTASPESGCMRDAIIFMTFKLQNLSDRKLLQEGMRPDPRLDRILAFQSVFGQISTAVSALEDDHSAYCSCYMDRLQSK